MGTYDHKQLLSDWSAKRITSDMSIGHLLQHLGLLYQAQDKIAKRQRQDRRQQAECNTTMTTQYQQLGHQVEQLQKQVNSLRLTIEMLTAQVDSLAHQLAKVTTD